MSAAMVQLHPIVTVVVHASGARTLDIDWQDSMHGQLNDNLVPMHDGPEAKPTAEWIAEEVEPKIARIVEEINQESGEEHPFFH